MTYPVTVTIDPALTNRNRLTTAFRIILAIPHLVLVGSVGFGGVAWKADHGSTSLGSETGLLGAAAFLLASVRWFTIVLDGQQLPGLRQFTAFYVRWPVP